jgi:hypothetical protein
MTSQKYHLNTALHEGTSLAEAIIHTSESRTPRAVRLLEYAIPVGWRNVDAFNNGVLFDEGGADIVGTIAVGQYNIDQYCVVLKTAMDDSTGALVYTISNSKGVVSISSTAGFTWKVAGTCSRMCGFNANQASVANAIVAPRLFSANPPSINIQCSLCAPNGTIQGQSPDRLLALVPIDKDFGLILRDANREWVNATGSMSEIWVKLYHENNARTFAILCDYSMTIEVLFA